VLAGDRSDKWTVTNGLFLMTGRVYIPLASPLLQAMLATTCGTLNDILSVMTFVAQSVEGRGTPLFSYIFLKELFASKSNLSMIFSKSSRSSFDTEHFSATDVTFCEMQLGCPNFHFGFLISLCRILFLPILSIY
jgi:hypothetical protein